jgi:hypothetical protein
MDNQFKLDGEILYIDDARPSKEGSTFYLRDFCIENSIMGESNHIKCQLKGTNVDKIDGFQPGDEVIISFALLGMAKIKEDKVKCATNPKGYDSFSPNVNVYKVEFVPGFVRTIKPAFNQPVNQPTQNQTQQQGSSPAGEVDDLPF